jgi:hypothetical protein
MAEPAKKTPREAGQGPARTRLGEKLLRIRRRIVKSGRPLLSWEQIEREVAERRGEPGQQGR